MLDLWKALIAEFIGTFTLVFIGAGASALTIEQGGSVLGTALAFGLTLIIIIYVWGAYSGGHFNPATTFGYALVNRISWGVLLAYWVAQLLGGLLAAVVITYIFGYGTGASVGSLTNTNPWKAVFVEGLLTFFLVLTILFVTRNPLISLVAGFAIGLVLAADMLVGYPFTGASMNPARSLGTALYTGNIGTYWIYVVGPLIGALIAALVFRAFTMNWGAHGLDTTSTDPFLASTGLVPGLTPSINDLTPNTSGYATGPVLAAPANYGPYSGVIYS